MVEALTLLGCGCFFRGRTFHADSCCDEHQEPDDARVACSFCSTATDLDDLDEGQDTWQQWKCPCCGVWNDKEPADG